jgi:hypothetical protein
MRRLILTGLPTSGTISALCGLPTTGETPSVVATRDVAVVEDYRCYHLATRSGPSCGGRL